MTLVTNEIGLALAGQTGRVYRIKVSSDLVHWTEVKTVTAVEENARIRVLTSGSAQFYRARPLAE